MPARQPARRFAAQETTTQRDLQSTLRKMGADSLRVGQDLKTGAAEIVFDRSGTRYVFRCAKWSNYADNLRAAQRTISLLYQALEEYGTSSEYLHTPKSKEWDVAFQRFFQPFAATPDDSVLLLGDGNCSWWEVLGVSESTTKGEITNAYRALAKVHHPDVGGSSEDFVRLRRAYEAGLAALGG